MCIYISFTKSKSLISIKSEKDFKFRNLVDNPNLSETEGCQNAQSYSSSKKHFNFLIF